MDKCPKSDKSAIKEIQVGEKRTRGALLRILG